MMFLGRFSWINSIANCYLYCDIVHNYLYMVSLLKLQTSLSISITPVCPKSISNSLEPTFGTLPPLFNLLFLIKYIHPRHYTTLQTPNAHKTLLCAPCVRSEALVIQSQIHRQAGFRASQGLFMRANQFPLSTTGFSFQLLSPAGQSRSWRGRMRWVYCCEEQEPVDGSRQARLDAGIQHVRGSVWWGILKMSGSRPKAGDESR